MAWQNVYIPIQGIPQSTITDFNLINQDQNNVNPGNYISFVGDLPQNCGLVTNTYVWGSAIGLALYAGAGAGTIVYRGYNNGAIDVSLSIGAESDTSHANRFYSYVIAIDDENQKGYIGFIRTWNSGGVPSSYAWWPGTNPTRYGSSAQYQLIKANIPLHFSWISVPEVMGKEGKVEFATLASSTDGNTVTDATEHAFLSLTEKAKLSRLYPNRVYGVDQLIAYSGENELYCKWTDATHFRISFMIYHSGSTYISYEYTLAHSNDDVWIQVLTTVLDDEITHVMRPSIIIKDAVTGLYSYNLESVTETQMVNLYDWLVFSFNGDSVFGEANDEAGGDGSIVLTDDPISAGTLFSQGGLFFNTLYWIDKENISSLIDWLKDEDVQIINKWFNTDPMEGLIGMALSPIDFDKNDYGSSSTVKIFGIDTEVPGRLMTVQFVKLDCGEFFIPYQMGGTYLDYAPYTMIKVWLPYIGMLEVNTDDVMNRWIKLEYTFDLLYGTCVAHLKVMNNDGHYSIHYERTGQFLFQLPFTKGDYTQMANTLKQAIMTAIVGIGTMAGGGLEGGLMQGQGGGVAGGLLGAGFNVMTSHPHVVYSGGSPSGLTGFMGVEKPYIMFEIPKLARPERDEEFIGMPSFITGNVSSFEGFTIFRSIHLTNIPCTENEQRQIESILTSGVLIESGSNTPTDTPQTAGNSIIIFLKNLSENNVLGKTFASTEQGTIKLPLEGKLVYEQSIETPRFLIKGNVSDYNYAYIPMMHRFYYINDIVLKENDLQEVYFNVDVLQSFKSEIKACEGVASSSKNRTNYFINDGSITAQQNKQVITKYFQKTGVNFSFNRNTDTGFLLTVANFK